MTEIKIEKKKRYGVDRFGTQYIALLNIFLAIIMKQTKMTLDTEI